MDEMPAVLRLRATRVLLGAARVLLRSARVLPWPTWPPRSCLVTIVAGLTWVPLGGLAPAVLAHEIGTTRVTVRFAPDTTFDVEVVTDAQALVEKLETVSDVPDPARTPADADAKRLEARIGDLVDVLRGRVQLAFDGQPAELSVSAAVAPGTGVGVPPTARLHLRGAYPTTARAFTWSYGWTFASYALLVEARAGGDGAAGGSPPPAVEWIEGGEASRPLAVAVAAPPPAWSATAARYLWLGFTHILPLGADHVLFVLGLFLLNSRARPLLAQVSAFTVAHSITLGLGAMGILSVPSRVVEPLIALSIAYVAVENLLWADLTRTRVAVVFACGLLHGLGFAGVLGELGLPRAHLLTALASFNIGVEAAQLAVIGAAFLLLGAGALHRPWYRERVVVPASGAIACVALYWTVTRIGA